MIDLPEAVDVYLDEQRARRCDRIDKELQHSAEHANAIDQWDALHQATEDWQHLKGDCDL